MGTESVTQTTPTTLDSLSESVDRLAGLRESLRALQTEERQITASIVRAIQTAGGRTAHGLTTTAVLDYSHTPTINPEMFFDMVGRKGFVAMRVLVTEARELIGESDLVAMATIRTTPVLRVVAK
jgi:hypothetical protein